MCAPPPERPTDSKKSAQHKNHCCHAAHARAPNVAGLAQARCTGTRWSTVFPGECKQKPNAVCTSGLSTRVTVTEYDLVWQVGTSTPTPPGFCTTRATARTHSVQSDECGGDNCPN